jgi:hypothetical protein
MERPEHIESYHGNGKYSFVNATIWQCIKFWIITTLTGGIKPDEENNS